MTFGEKLQNLRKARGWSQEELAEQIGVSRQALSKWELGTSLADTENVLKLSRLFGVSTDYLLYDEYESDRDIPAVQRGSEELLKQYQKRKQTVISEIFLAIGLLGLVILGIAVSVSSWDFASFLWFNRLWWLVALLVICVIIGMFPLWSKLFWLWWGEDE